MLSIEHDPIEASASNYLGTDRAAQTAPQADLPLASTQGLLEGIVGSVCRGFEQSTVSFDIVHLDAIVLKTPFF